MQEKWYKEGVVYQVYPRSFKDSNNDGIGDVNGIIEKIPYLKDIGINILWVSPIYQSPMIDNGYDISDYYDINP
ncbi:MAG: glucohydrolase, partial [Candidatus Izimaplasma sp.]|nr:glucohydrolase [Candidatus Izimaplasma bacterium]